MAWMQVPRSVAGTVTARRVISQRFEIGAKDRQAEVLLGAFEGQEAFVVDFPQVAFGIAGVLVFVGAFAGPADETLQVGVPPAEQLHCGFDGGCEAVGARGIARVYPI